MNQHISKKRLADYVNRLSDSAEIETIEQHLATCGRCTSQLKTAQAEHENLISLLHHRLEAITPASAFVDVAQRLPKAQRRSRPQRIAARPAFATAFALLAVLICGFAIYNALPSFNPPAVSAPSVSVPVSQLPSPHGQNMGFEDWKDDVPIHWLSVGPAHEQFTVEREMQGNTEGESGVRYSGQDVPANEFATITQFALGVNELIGQRIRFSVDVSTDLESGWAGAWMRVDGKANNDILQFDNMEERPIEGKTEWQTYSVVLDVPVDTARIAYGILSTGDGDVWIDNAILEVVGNEIPSTNMFVSDISYQTDSEEGSIDITPHALPLNFKLIRWPYDELQSTRTVPFAWHFITTHRERYGIKRSNDTSDDNPNSVRLFSLVENRIDPVGETRLIQAFWSGAYPGQQVRFSADVKTNINQGYASIYVHNSVEDDHVIIVDEGDGWTNLSVVLDAPERSPLIEVHLTFAGDGEVWFDNLKFEVLEDGVPILTTP